MRLVRNIILLSFIFISAFFIFEIFDRNKLEESKTILLKAGISSFELSSILEQEKIINNKFVFLFYAKFLSGPKKLIAGEYEFEPKANIPEIFEIISRGESVRRKILISEGYSSYQIVELLNSEPRLVGAIKDMPEDGTLFPSTYYFRYGDLRSSIINAMHKKMNRILEEREVLLKTNKLIKNRKDLIALASIIEKEAGNNEEKPIIASVFLNRLKKKMRLQSDPTVIYAVTDGTMILKRPLSKTDLKIDSPYNTYKYYGIPPKAIANPGIKSIDAVLNPADTKFLFFVSDGNGKHNFSTNLAEHNGYVAYYRKLVKN